MYKYFPHTDEDIRQMLDKVGVDSLDGLYADVPEQLRIRGGYRLPEAQSEEEVRDTIQRLANQNQTLRVLAGGGVYDKYVPAAVPRLCARSEFLTSYTPYQAEISQGTLHYIFEYQTMMARLTGMDVSNASLYDGATATAEAMLMANAVSKKAHTVIVSETVDEKTRRVVNTYAHYHGVDILTIGETDGATDRQQLAQRLAQGDVAGVIVQQPNRYGIVEDYTGLADEVHAQKGLFIMNCIAADLALLKTPREWGADVAVGEGQSLGLPMNFGGPYLGYMCVTEKLMRKMPGRIVGQTVDTRGERTFVLTLQAREQHIRRQRATSNICSNESLMALWVTIYMSLMGRQGLRQAAQLSHDGAHYLCQQLEQTGHWQQRFPGKPFFNEFCMTYDGNVDDFQQKAISHSYMAGLKVDEHTVMFAVTEKHPKKELDSFLSTL